MKSCYQGECEFQIDQEGSVAQWIEHQTLNTWMAARRGFEPDWCQKFCELLVPLSKALYSNCSVVQRSRKAVGPMYMYLNINTSVHVKERHRLFEKNRGSSRYCWLYFKTALIYWRFQSMGQGPLWLFWVPKVQLICTQCNNTQTYEVCTNNRRRSYFALWTKYLLPLR